MRVHSLILASRKALLKTPILRGPCWSWQTKLKADADKIYVSFVFVSVFHGRNRFLKMRKKKMKKKNHDDLGKDVLFAAHSHLHSSRRVFTVYVERNEKSSVKVCKSENKKRKITQLARVCVFVAN